MNKKIKEIEQITNEKWLNLFKIKDDMGDYFFVSRKNKQDLVAFKNQASPDAVRILPYFKKNNKTYVVFIKEYRRAVARYMFSFPAGLVDEGETPLLSAKRELLEEIGASVINIEKISNNLFSSPGLTDECLMLFQAEVSLDHKQQLESTEDIEVQIVELEKIPQLLKDEDFCMCSYLMAQSFYYKNANLQKTNEISFT